MDGYKSDLINWKPHSFPGTGRLKTTAKNGFSIQ